MDDLRKSVLDTLEELGLEELEKTIKEWCLTERDYFYTIPINLNKLEKYCIVKGNSELIQAVKKTISYFELAAKNRHPMIAHFLADFDAGDGVFYIHMGIERTDKVRNEEEWLISMLELLSTRFPGEEIERLRLQVIFNRDKAIEEINLLVDEYEEQCREKMEFLNAHLYQRIKTALEKLN